MTPYPNPAHAIGRLVAGSLAFAHPRRLAAAVIFAVLASGTVVSAESTESAPSWTVQGSIVVSLQGGCSFSPTCQAFLAAGRLGGGCESDSTVQDGLEISIVQLPDEAPGGRALFAWSSSAHALSGMTVGWIGEVNGVCQELSSVTLQDSKSSPLFGYGSGLVTVEPRARFAYVSAERATDVSWYLGEQST